MVLDLMLPGMNGLEVCRSLREESRVPIVMLTARAEEDDRVAGFDLGADDYVTKPFSPRELAARIRAVLRRTAQEGEDNGPSQLTYAGIAVDTERRAALVDDAAVKLTPTEFRLLTLLVRHPGTVFSREQIINRVFGYDFDGLDRTVDTHISSLRRKLEDAGGGRSFIHTVYGVGYKLTDG